MCGRTKKRQTPNLRLFLWVFFFFAFVAVHKPRGRILSQYFMSDIERGVEAGRGGLQCMEQEFPATMPTLNYFLWTSTIFAIHFSINSLPTFLCLFCVWCGIDVCEKRSRERCEFLGIKSCYWIILHIIDRIATFLFTSWLWLCLNLFFPLRFRLIYLSFFPLIFLPVSTHTLSCSHIWMYTNICVHKPTPSYREGAI